MFALSMFYCILFLSLSFEYCSKHTQPNGPSEPNGDAGSASENCGPPTTGDQRSVHAPCVWGGPQGHGRLATNEQDPDPRETRYDRTLF